MAAPIISKCPLEIRLLPFNMMNLVASGAILSSVQCYASLSTSEGLKATTTAAAINVGDPTVSLNADPGAGALLIIEPSAGKEERLKVTSIAGSAPWVATVAPIAWDQHNSGVSVTYEPGRTARMLVDDTPTPSGTSVTLLYQQGTDGLTYRISAIGVCNNGETVEDEVTVLITDALATVTNIKQPTETRYLAADLSSLLEEAHQSASTISSAVAYAMTTTTTATTLTAPANPGDTTLTLNDHPGIGAKLIVEPTATLPTAYPEKFYVSNVSGGAGAWIATISPSVEFVHNNGSNVTVYLGVTTNFLSSASSTVDTFQVKNLGRRGPAGKTFKVVWLATTSLGEKLQHVGNVELTDI